MGTYVYCLEHNAIIVINNLYYTIQNIQPVYKTKRRYERSIWYPKNAGYDSYKLIAINVFTKEPFIKIYSADTLFEIQTPIKTEYSVVDINNNIITLLTKNYTEKIININDIDIDINTYAKIQNFLNNNDVGDIIITILTGVNLLKIINLQIIKCIE
jgi:hypothetical protein